MADERKAPRIPMPPDTAVVVAANEAQPERPDEVRVLAEVRVPAEREPAWGNCR